VSAPRSTSSTSGTPLARKLGIAPGHTVLLLGAPSSWSVPDLPDGVGLRRRGSFSGADVAVAFLRSMADVAPRLAAAVHYLDAHSALWLAWPRRAGGHTSDITDEGLREMVLPTGLVDVKVAALDDDWSGLRFVWRKELR
jgi:hypothetical protein